MGNQIALEKYLTTAHSAGMPADQVTNFVNAGYVAQPKQCEFHAAARRADSEGGPVEILLGGARGGAKSHGAFAQVALDDCIRAPGLHWLYLRNIKLSAAEAFEQLIDKVLRYEPHEFVRNTGLLRLPNESTVICGGFRNDNDIEKYLGFEYDGVLVEEATSIAPRKLEMVYGSVRTSRTDWRPRKYLTTNPGGVGHQEIKKRFILPYRAGRQTDTFFVPANYHDNLFLDAEYIKYLEGLTGILGRMWRDGDWDVSAGQAFPDFSLDRHVIDPLEIDMNFPKVRGFDYGFIHPSDTLWRAKVPASGRIIVYREFNTRFLSDELLARSILDMTPQREQIYTTYASPDMWQRKAGDNKLVTTPAEEFMKEHLPLTQADNHRANGAAKIHRLLAPLPDGKPGLQITSDCVKLIECLPAMLSDPNDPEDVLKVDADPETGEGGDDPYDCLRYLLTDAAAEVYKRVERKPLPLQRLGEGRT